MLEILLSNIKLKNKRLTFKRDFFGALGKFIFRFQKLIKFLLGAISRPNF